MLDYVNPLTSNTIHIMSIATVLTILNETNPSWLLSAVKPEMVRKAILSVPKDVKLDLLQNADNRQKVSAFIKMFAEKIPMGKSYIIGIADSITGMADLTYAKLAISFALDIFQSEKLREAKHSLREMFGKFKEILTRDIVKQLSIDHIKAFKDVPLENLPGIAILQQATGHIFKQAKAAPAAQPVVNAVVQQQIPVTHISQKQGWRPYEILMSVLTVAQTFFIAKLYFSCNVVA